MYRIRTAAASLLVLAVSAIAAGQSSSPADLQLQIDAYNLMNTAGGPMVQDAEIRSEQMHRFIAEESLESDWKTYSGSGDFDGLSFDEVVAKATDMQREKGLSEPSSQNIGDLQAQAAGAKMLAESKWKKVDELHAANAAMTTFLREKDRMDAYHDWAEIEVAKRQKQEDADALQRKEDRQQAQLEEDKARAERAQAAHDDAADLRYSLDEQHHQNDPADDDYDAYDEDSTYYNGYADPYYDVWGRPVVRHERREERREDEVRENVRQDNRQDNRGHNAYNRSNSRPNNSSSRGHPSRGRR